MKYYNKEKPLISIHIPKTGGTSFRPILRKWFGTHLYFHYFDEKNNKMPMKYKLLPGICIHGHFNKRRNFGIEDYYPEVDQFITFLRDPFEVMISRYFFEKKREARNNSFRDGKRLHLNDDINEYLETEIRKPDYHPNILDYMPVEITFDNYKEVIDNCFIYIGIINDFQFSVIRMSEKLNFPSFEIEHINQSPRFKEISPHIKQLFINSHPLEHEIFHYALKNYKSW